MARTAAYDRDAVIEQAVLQFWTDGFAPCDVESLTRAAGLNRHSLYKAFGGKSGLFVEAVNHYIAREAAGYLALLEKGSDLSALVTYFERATKSIQTPRNDDADERRGCLITNTVIEMGRSDKDVAEIIDRYFARVERAFCDLIKRSQKNGTIRADLDPKATARWLFITSQGMSVSARFGRTFSGLPEIVRAALAPISA